MGEVINFIDSNVGVKNLLNSKEAQKKHIEFPPFVVGFRIRNNSSLRTIFLFQVFESDFFKVIDKTFFCFLIKKSA